MRNIHEYSNAVSEESESERESSEERERGAGVIYGCIKFYVYSLSSLSKS
jgi:hypothetical protein